MIRLAHFSDIHLTIQPLGWQASDWLTKRTAGWVNRTMLGRASRFRAANDVMVALRREFAARGFDHLVFSGDASTLGFPRELQYAAERLGVGDPQVPAGIAVPGNHDVYIRRNVRQRSFEAAFAPWLSGRRVNGNDYPFAQKVGHVWLIALNSAKPNTFAWDASGHVEAQQLAAFRQLCAQLDAGPRIVVSHYPLLMENHRPEPFWHRLRNWAEVRTVAADCGISLWLHGHRHQWYYLAANDILPFPAICCGSSTQLHRWGYHDYTIDGWKLHAVRRVYDAAEQSFRDATTFTLTLPAR
ncbi:MAG: metallophosphoesterase [Gemmataceae bacterium]|nr:metallophosphoesterase [Gemmata sp.]MDW8198484.1 metallophosphoesterase [Gemmataceae bacterium]